jgi:hypothetical protein
MPNCIPELLKSVLRYSPDFARNFAKPSGNLESRTLVINSLPRKMTIFGNLVLFCNNSSSLRLIQHERQTAPT